MRAAKLVLDGGKAQVAVARALGVSQSILSDWVRRARSERGDPSAGLTLGERAELAVLRKEHTPLKMEREFAKKAAAFFAKQVP